MENYRFGLLASIVSNLVLDKDGTPREPADFFNDLPRAPRPVQSDQAQMTLLSGIVAKRGGEVRTVAVDREVVDAEFEEVRRKMEAARTGGGNRGSR